MSRRHRGAGAEFGSDSFLDIIANIVGILIILIVVAGVKVARAPVAVSIPPVSCPRPDGPIPSAAEAVLSKTPVIADGPPIVAEDAPIEDVPIATDAVPADPRLTAAILAASEPPLPPKPIERPPLPPAIAEPRPPRIVPIDQNLLAKIEKVRTEIVSLRSALSQRERELAEVRQQIAQWKQRTAESAEQVDSQQAELTRRRGRLAELQREYDAVQMEFIGKQRELAAAEADHRPKRMLEHRYTPVSREVRGAEIHFHLKNGRIALVPLDDLVERMKGQLQRQKSWLAKSRQFEGRVGPIRGFRNDYVVVRQGLSVLEAARLGTSAVRVVPVLLKFIPEENVYSESIPEALAPGSQFIRTLQMAKPGTTLTFWVYPDSYRLYRELKSFAHEEGFTVAARPLEMGNFITASPFGTRSAAQ